MKGIAARKEKTALDILNDDADTLAVSFRASGYALSSLTFAAEATVEEKLSILGGLLSAVTAKLTAAQQAQESAAAAVSEIRTYVKNQTDAQNALTAHITKRKAAFFEKASHRAISVSEEKRENAVIAVLESVEQSLSGNDLSACVSLLGDKTKQTMSDASKCLENTILFLFEAFGEGREMTLFTSGICENRACSKFLRVFGCEIFFAHASNPEKRHDAITRQIEELQQTL